MTNPLDRDPNFKMSQEEAKAFEAAMKKPEFVDLLSEYMNEISDPNNREEYDQYLKQLEKEQELPKGMKLLKPSPEFCLKTSLKGKKDTKFTTKLFINICSTAELQRPTFETGSKLGQTGQNWKVPYITNKPRYDQDKKKNVCTTIDVAFHPHAFELLLRNRAFEKLLCSTAIESAEKQLLERNEVVSRDYKILKKINCKGGEPATMTIRGSRLKEDPQKKQDDYIDNRQKEGDYAPKLFKEFIKNKKENKDKINEEKEEMENEAENVEKGLTIDELERQGEETIDCPKYEVFYSYESEYFDYIEKREEKIRKMPKNMRFEVDLQKMRPKIDNISDMKLDINENNLILDIPKKYYLDIKLTYPVLSEIGNAKYDPKNKKLKIFLVINQSKLSEFMKEKEPEPPKIEELPQIKQEENSNIISEGEEIPEIKQEIEKNEMKFENYEAESEIQDSLLEFKEKNCLLKMAQKNPKKEENEKEEKKLIEEIIETDKNIVKTEKNIEKVENQIKIPKILDFKTQENSQKYFIIINIPNYSKENCYVRNISNEILFLYENVESFQYLWIKMIEDILVESYEINYVIDYIVMNLSKKTENQFFDKSFGENLTREYCEFQNKFQEIKPVIKEEIIKEEDRGIEINENQKHLDEIQNIDREDNYEKKDEETLMIEESRKEEIKIESIEKRQQIQFIGYNFPFIYELD